MDLNQLYFDHQILRMQADRSNTAESAAQHDRSAALVAIRIGSMQQILNAGAAAGWTAMAANDPRPTPPQSLAPAAAAETEA